MYPLGRLAITFGLHSLLILLSTFPICCPPPSTHTFGWWRNPRLAPPRPIFLTWRPSPQPTFPVAAETHFLLPFSAGGSGLKKPVSLCRDLRSPPLPQGSRRGAPLTSDPTRGGSGWGQVRSGPPLAAEGACAAAAEARRWQVPAVLDRGRPGPIGWGGGSASPATRRSEKLPDPTARGRQGVPPQPLPTS